MTSLADWLEGWRANYYAQYGETEQEQVFDGGLIMGRLATCAGRRCVIRPQARRFAALRS